MIKWKLRLSESQAEGGELNQSQSVGTCIVIGLFFRFCFRLRKSGFHWIVNDGVVSGVRRKWKRSDSSDSVARMTLLTTTIFYFQKVISAVTTPLTTPTLTPSLVKTILKCISKRRFLCGHKESAIHILLEKQIKKYATSTSPIMHLICPLRFCISIVFSFSWNGCNTQERWKTKVMQKLGRGGAIRCLMGNVLVAYGGNRYRRKKPRQKCWKDNFLKINLFNNKLWLIKN